MDYKKIIRSRKIRFKILNFLSFIPDKTMIKIQYRMKTGRKLNLKNPQRFTEKLQWYKLNYRNPIMHQCVDKYEVRKYVKSKGLEDILNELYGIYNSTKEIDYSKLPNKFVLKTTAGGGGNNTIICEDKQKYDINKNNKMIDEWLRINTKKSVSREWAYEGLNNRIIIERILEGNDDNLSGINDYKFFCYNGKVEYIVFDGDRYVKHKRNFYDKDWNYIDIDTDCDKMGDSIEKPKMLEEMKKVAEKLAEDFPFVRVDLYCINNKIYFGELTFYPWGGYVKYNPDEFDYELGKKFELTIYNNERR